jgi:hypothetical protein
VGYIAGNKRAVGEHRAWSRGHGTEILELGSGNAECGKKRRGQNFEFGMRNDVRRSWEAGKVRRWERLLFTIVTY